MTVLDVDNVYCVSISRIKIVYATVFLVIRVVHVAIYNDDRITPTAI
jgi:hypothetical protein